MIDTLDKVELLAQPETKTWSGNILLQVVEDQLKGQYLPYEKYPQVIEFTDNDLVLRGFRAMEEEQVKGIQEIANDPSLEKYAFDESHLQLYHKNEGGWRLGKPLYGGQAQVCVVAVDEDADPSIEELAIHFHVHGFHSQLTRFFSTPDLRFAVGKIPSLVECVTMPGMNFIALATKDTPQLSEKEIEEKLSLKDPDKLKQGFAQISKRLKEIGQSGQVKNIYKKSVLPRIPIKSSIFDQALSEYGVSLTNYIYVLRVARELKLVVYCAKTGSNRFVRLDEIFNPKANL